MEGTSEPLQCAACSRLTGYVMDKEEWHQMRCGLRDRENLSRIHIIGGPGSGKTTLARKIGAILGVKAHELDQIAFAGPDFTERPIPDRMADLYLIANRPAWVTEGLFVLWTEELLARANMIIWLDHVGWERGFVRITRRFVESAIHEARNRHGLERFTRFSDYARHIKQFVQVFFSSREYFTRHPPRSGARIESRMSTAAFLAPYKDKVIHCYDDDAVEAVIDYVRLCLADCK